MTFEIATILTVDGIGSGAIYALVALGVVLIFTVTRVIFVPFGEIATFTALTLSAIELGRAPGTIGFVAVLAVLATAMEVVSLLRAWKLRLLPRALAFYLALPLAAAGIVFYAVQFELPHTLQIVLALLLMVPVAPLLDRIVFRSIADATVLQLLIVSVALHFALVGVGLMLFGPEGVRTQPLTDMSLEFGGILLSGQTILIVLSALLFSTLLFTFFKVTLLGKALRATAVNRTGARLMGIRPTFTGTIAYILGSIMAGVSGILIAPVTTIFYDSGFLLGLKAFIGAIIGGMISYPGAAFGTLLVGLLESFASFQSSAFKEVIVFSLLIPILLWPSLKTSHSEEEDEE